MSDWAVWGAPEWANVAWLALAAGGAALAWSYWSAPARPAWRTLAMLLKTCGLAALVLCLVEPLLTGTRPRKGANLFAVAVDDSQSLQIHDAGALDSRGDLLQKTLLAETSWQTRLGQDFDVRRFVFESQLRGVKDFAQLDFLGDDSRLAGTLDALAKRFRGLPLGGVLLFTDGNATDAIPADFDWSQLPSVYPVVLGGDDPPPDLCVERVAVSQTNFESAPVALQADLRAVGAPPKSLVAKLYDEKGRELESQTVEVDAAGAASARFQVQPVESGVVFYQVRTFDPAHADDPQSAEATLMNNERTVVVDRGDGPYRVLYVSGRPNWEFKFLRRALSDDDQLELVGLVRIAKREPKFTFRRRGERPTNQLFDGFDHESEETAERYDEPVLVRLGTRDAEELREGFPKTADALYEYDALVLDDVDAEFFTGDQLALVEDFVSRRGGGFLMLSGMESFAEGAYRRTPLAGLLPVYLDGTVAGTVDGESRFVGDQYRLALTREGWLQPWVRLRKTEAEDRARLDAMPPFRTVSQVGRIKPGASELAQVIDFDGNKQPALVAQRFGRGRAAALLVGDLWRWGLHRENQSDDDLDKAWRQMIRWLVADVPQQVEVETAPPQDPSQQGATIYVQVLDKEFLPLENAEVNIRVAGPDGSEITLRGEASRGRAGDYTATHVSRTPGAYRAAVEVTAPDGSPLGERQTGWVAQPLADEFNRLQPNRALLEEIAAKTGGEVLSVDDLDEFVAGLPSRKMPISEPWVRPLWHHPLFFLFAVACLIGEWGLRRWKGLA